MRSFICFLCCVSMMLSFFPSYANASDAEHLVLNVDIGIVPEIYRELTNNSEKKKYEAYVNTEDGAYQRIDINIRGSSSRELGLLTTVKRIPFEIKQSNGVLFADTLSNKSVKFINSFSLYRLIAEYLALELFASVEIPTPEHRFAFVQFNGVDFGLYLAIEDVNSQFLAKHYKGKLHSAYKATNNEEKADRYIDSVWFGHLFEKVSNGSHNLAKLIAALDAGKGYEKYINFDEWLKYFACVAVSGGAGSIFTQVNNFVLYDNAGKFDLIPWDLSECFGGESGPSGIDRYYIWSNSERPNPLFDLLMQKTENRDKYHAYIREITEAFLRPEKIQSLYTAVLDALEPYLPRDHSIYLNNEDAINQLRSDKGDNLLDLRYVLNGFYTNLNEQLAGTANTFFVNEIYNNITIEESFDSLLEQVEAFSPLYDPTLPDQICAAYNNWFSLHKSELRTNEIQIEEPGKMKNKKLLTVLLLSGSGLVVAIAVYIIILKKGRFKKSPVIK